MASIDFTEKFAVITSSPAFGSWTTIDLTSLGVPDNAVVCILITNPQEANWGTAGVKHNASSLNRYLIQHEAEGGGVTSIIMHVQADEFAQIKYFTDNTSSVFTLLGYYGSGITYTEEKTLHEPTVAGWRSTAVGQNDTVFEFCCQNIDAGNTATNVGTREVGSSLARYMDIHEAEGGGVNSYTSYAQSDGSGNVELYRGDTYGQFYRLGYFSSNVQLEEAFDACTPASDATWGEQTIVAGGENCVGLIACMHSSAGTEEYMGARGGASAVNRYWLEHEAEGGGFSGDTLPVLVDAGGKYDTYHGDVSDALFYCLGYLYDTGGAPAAVAPTSVLYGPFVGPLGGPV